MIATAMLSAQSPNGFNFSVKIQAKSALEILVLAMPRPPVPMGLKGARKMIAGGGAYQIRWEIPSRDMYGQAAPRFNGW
jgi:hypothetical protein